MLDALKRHWPEYLIEAGGLALFMMSACSFGSILEHPSSPVRKAIGDPVLRRALMGIAMGSTAMAIVYSRWGKRSGAHINPSITLTFYRLGKIEPSDAFFYVAAQFLGGIAGVLVSGSVLGPILAHPRVHYVATVPGARGVLPAFAAEVVISFLLMTAILTVSNRTAIARYTGILAGTLAATYIFIEAPVSGMSMNPARTLGSAVPAGVWTAVWIYFTAPPLGMLLAAAVYSRRGVVRCAKLHHQNSQPCIFRCGYMRAAAAVATESATAAVLPQSETARVAAAPSRG
jgi:aquaporin Z